MRGYPQDLLTMIKKNIMKHAAFENNVHDKPGEPPRKEIINISGKKIYKSINSILCYMTYCNEDPPVKISIKGFRTPTSYYLYTAKTIDLMMNEQWIMDNVGKSTNGSSCNMLTIDVAKLPKMKVILHENCKAGKNYYIDFNLKEHKFTVHDDIRENANIKEMLDNWEEEYRKAYQEMIDKGLDKPEIKVNPNATIFSNVTVNTSREALDAVEAVESIKDY
jgi:hypothetical protein